MRLRKWLIPGLVAALLGLGGLAYAQFGPNTLSINSAASGSAPSIAASGLDANVSINLIPKGTGTVQINGTAIPGVGGGAGVFSSLTVNGASALNGLISARPGASVVSDNLGAIVLANSSTNATTALAATETDLFNFSIPANTLSANNQYLHLTFRDRNAATGNTKQLRMYFGAQLIGDTTAVASNNNWYFGDCYIWRTGAATQKAICGAVNVTNGGSWATGSGGGATISTPAENTTGAITIRITGTDGVAAGGSNLEGVNLVWYPAGQ